MALKGVTFHYLPQLHFWSKSENKTKFSTVCLLLLGELIACPKLLYNGKGRHSTLMDVFTFRQKESRFRGLWRKQVSLPTAGSWASVALLNRMSDSETAQSEYQRPGDFKGERVAVRWCDRLSFVFSSKATRRQAFGSLMSPLRSSSQKVFVRVPEGGPRSCIVGSQLHLQGHNPDPLTPHLMALQHTPAYLSPCC